MKIEIKRLVNLGISLCNSCDEKKLLIVKDFREESEWKWQYDEKINCRVKKK